MSFGTAEREKAEVAFAAAAAFGFLTARHGNRFGLLVVGRRRRSCGSDRARRGPSCSRRCRSCTTSPDERTRPGRDADLAGDAARARARLARGAVRSS